MRLAVIVVSAMLGANACSRTDPEVKAAERATPQASSAAARDRDPRCIGKDVRKPCSLYSVSLIELIARPERYDGRRVVTVGFAALSFESQGLYVSQANADNGVTMNGVWLEEPPTSAKGAGKWLWNDRYVMVEGTFRAQHTGHMGMWIGAIEDLSTYRATGGGDPRQDELRKNISH